MTVMTNGAVDPLWALTSWCEDCIRMLNDDLALSTTELTPAQIEDLLTGAEFFERMLTFLQGRASWVQPERDVPQGTLRVVMSSLDHTIARFDASATTAHAADDARTETLFRNAMERAMALRSNVALMAGTEST